MEEKTKGKAATRAKNKYAKETYDRIYLFARKGRKELYVAMAERSDKTLNKYVGDILEHCILHEEEYAKYDALAREKGTALEELIPQLLSEYFNV